MSMNCLTCQILQRSDSEGEYGHKRKQCCSKRGRSWSGNLTPPAYQELRSASMLLASRKVKKASHRRLNTTGTVFEGSGGPKLVRSSGMRRDWSFEDLRKEIEEKREERVH